jgi:ParB family chromosome partitioning protein
VNKVISKVKEIDVATVAGNNTLATAMDKRSVARCKEAIETLGVVHTPVVGITKDGNRMLFSGQSELMALRELGIKTMDAVEVDVTDDAKIKSKLLLLLLSLREKPGALCEGLLIREALNTGVNRTEIQAILSKSASWVSNRLSLVTRLDRNVYAMVKDGLIEARSAEEVSRLPTIVQFAFAETVVREGLAKSAIESLVAGYNDETCPDEVKAQMLVNPREALKRLTDKRRAVNTEKSEKSKTDENMGVIGAIIKSLMSQMHSFRQVLSNLNGNELIDMEISLNKLDSCMMALHSAILDSYSQIPFPRVKTEVS